MPLFAADKDKFARALQLELEAIGIVVSATFPGSSLSYW